MHENIMDLINQQHVGKKVLRTHPQPSKKLSKSTTYKWKNPFSPSQFAEFLFLVLKFIDDTKEQGIQRWVRKSLLFDFSVLQNIMGWIILHLKKKN